MKLTPLVSIVIPVYNGSNYLEEAIKSALNQTYSNLEIIVVNDGSNDNNRTKEIALQYKNDIIYIEKSNGGVASALNEGIANMKGDYFSWLSHDDRYYPNKIELQMRRILESSPNSLIWSNYDVIDSSSRLINQYNPKDFKYYKNQLEYIIYTKVHGCSLLIPKKAFKQIGYFNEHLKTVQDNNMWFRILTNGYTLIHINQSLIQSRHHQEQGSITMNNIHKKETQDFFLWVYDIIYDDPNYDQSVKNYVQNRIEQ